MQQTVVIKFGGAAVATPESFALIADLVIAKKQQYQQIVVVVSAMGDTTDDLIALAHKVNPSPPRREYDMLVSVGERISVSLLAMALAAKGYEAISFTGSQSGIITCPRHSDARIIDVRPHRIHKCLSENKIAIVAGFQGVSRAGDITTLGRGGSDTTAVALGIALDAKVQFFKNVDGIYDKDPRKHPEEAIFYSELSYKEAAAIITASIHQVLHLRCIELAEKNCLPLHVLSFSQQIGEKSGGSHIYDRTFSAKNSCNEPVYENA